MTAILTEYDLLNRLVSGDRNAFDALYRLYCHPVFCNALHITRNRQSAEDIVQEVFIGLWEKRTGIETNKPVGGWLFVNCYNKSISLLRKNLRQSLAADKLSQPLQDSLADYIEIELQWELLEQAIGQLSPQRRKVFELCKMQGKTYEETAEALQLSKHTVKEYLSASINFLKDYVQHHPQSSMAAIVPAFIALLLHT